MQLDITIDETLITPAKHAKLMRELYRETLEYHREITLPKHFTKAAYGLYGLPKRGKGYQLSKARRFHHQLPNVWTGETRRLAAQSKVTATQYGSRLYFKSHFPMTKERRAEIEIIIGPEGEKMGERIAREYVNRLPLFQRKRKPKRR